MHVTLKKYFFYSKPLVLYFQKILRKKRTLKWTRYFGRSRMGWWERCRRPSRDRLRQRGRARRRRPRHLPLQRRKHSRLKTCSHDWTTWEIRTACIAVYFIICILWIFIFLEVSDLGLGFLVFREFIFVEVSVNGLWVLVRWLGICEYHIFSLPMSKQCLTYWIVNSGMEICLDTCTS